MYNAHLFTQIFERKNKDAYDNPIYNVYKNMGAHCVQQKAIWHIFIYYFLKFYF